MPKKSTVNQYKYDATHCRTFRMKLNLTIDADIIAKLTSVPSIQGYLKQLVRKDLSDTVSVSFPDPTLESLKERAEKIGVSVPDLVKIIVSEQLIRT